MKCLEKYSIHLTYPGGVSKKRIYLFFTQSAKIGNWGCMKDKTLIPAAFKWYEVLVEVGEEYLFVQVKDEMASFISFTATIQNSKMHPILLFRLHPPSREL